MGRYLSIIMWPLREHSSRAFLLCWAGEELLFLRWGDKGGEEKMKWPVAPLAKFYSTRVPMNQLCSTVKATGKSDPTAIPLYVPWKCCCGTNCTSLKVFDSKAISKTTVFKSTLLLLWWRSLPAICNAQLNSLYCLQQMAKVCICYRS